MKPRAKFEKCQMLNKWEVFIIEFILLLHHQNPRDREKISEEKRLNLNLKAKERSFQVNKGECYF